MKLYEIWNRTFDFTKVHIIEVGDNYKIYEGINKYVPLNLMHREVQWIDISADILIIEVYKEK